MKRLLLSLTLLSTLVGCSQTDVLQEGDNPAAIAFDTYIGKNSRAATVSQFKEGDILGVYMYHSPAGWDTDGLTGSNPLMQNVNLHLDAGAWIYSPTLFWQKDQKYTFFGYAPRKESVTVTSGALAYTVGADEATQEDLLYAVPSTSTKDKSWDGTATPPGKVQFAFTHALSQVKFSVATQYDYSSLYTIQLIGIGLKNINSTGNLNLIAASNSQSPWSNQGTPAAVSYTPAAVELSTTLQPVTNDANDVWMLLPQTLPVDALAEFTLKLTKLTSVGTATDGDYKVTASLTGQSLVGEWGHNKVHHYQVTLNMDQILGVRPIVIGDPDIIPWEEEPEEEIPLKPKDKVEFAFAPPTATDEIAIGEKIGVLGYQLMLDESWNPQSVPGFMYNVPLTKSADGFSYSSEQRYPMGGQKVKFFAYYPYSATAGDENITLSGSKDPGYPTLSITGNGKRNLMAGASAPCNEGSVDLPLKHIMGELNIKLNRGVASNAAFTVNKIVVSGIKTGGTFSFEHYVASPTNTANWWTVTGTATTLTFDGLSQPLDQEVVLLKNIYLVPQTIAAGTLKVTVHYNTAKSFEQTLLQEVTLKAGEATDCIIKLTDGGLPDIPVEEW